MHALVHVRCCDSHADREAVARIHASCLPSEGWTAEDVRRFCDRPGRVARLITTEDGRPIGSLLYEMAADTVRLRRLAVLPAYRRRGVASYAVSSQLTGRGALNRKRLVTARVREHDVAMQKLLRKHGFAFYGKLDGFYQRQDCGGLVQDTDAYLFQLDKGDECRRRRRESRPAWAEV